MEKKILSLKGSLRDSSGKALPNMFVAIVDVDSLDSDDLIGLGTTDENGGFGMSFMPSEFQQDIFEDEETPDIKIIVSMMRGEERIAIFEQRFHDLEWKNLAADLGEIVLQGVNLEMPVALEGVEAIPGVNKRAKRLDIDDDLVRHCLAEVAPIVEHLTGWKGLLDGVKVEVSNTLAPYMLRETFVGEGIDPDSFSAKFVAFFTNFMQGPGAGCALYDPHIHTIVVNKKIMSQVGIEALKIICGHELVHVGQYKYTPGLKEYNLWHLRNMKTTPESFDPDELKAKGAYMIELEGYAKYIEEDFLHQKYYKMANMSYHASVLEKVVQGLVAMTSDQVQAGRDNKANQYTEGLERYRKRQVGDIPARFQLDVASLPGGEAFAC